MNWRFMKRWVSAASVLVAASMTSSRSEAEPPYHFLDVRAAVTGDVLGTFTARPSGGEGPTPTLASGAMSSAISASVELVHSWEWLPNYGGIDLTARLGFDTLKGDFLGPDETVYSPNIGLGLGYVQPVNRYFQIELVPSLGIGASYLSFEGSEYSGITSKYGVRGNFVVTIADSFQVVAIVGYSWYVLSFSDLGNSGVTIAVNGASVGGGLGATF
jgi:hypothetical protein